VGFEVGLIKGSVGLIDQSVACCEGCKSHLGCCLQVLMGRNSIAKVGDLGVAQEIPEGALTVELPDLVGTFAWTVRMLQPPGLAVT